MSLPTAGDMVTSLLAVAAIVCAATRNVSTKVIIPVYPEPLENVREESAGLEPAFGAPLQPSYHGFNYPVDLPSPAYGGFSNPSANPLLPSHLHRSPLHSAYLLPPINPLLSALLLSSLTSSHPHNPYIGLLLANYGKYLPYGIGSYGLYGYSASNNLHNSRAFGASYIIEDRLR